MEGKMKIVGNSEVASRFAKGVASKYRFRFIELLSKAGGNEMLLSALIKECSSDPEYYIAYQTALFHLTKMEKAGIVKVEDVILPQTTHTGRSKIQLKVTLLKNVKIYIEDLGS